MSRPRPVANVRRRRGWRSPTFQIAVAGVVMVAGAYLIALWMVGVVLMFWSILFAADALLRDSPHVQRRPVGTVEDVMERYRRAK